MTIPQTPEPCGEHQIHYDRTELDRDSDIIELQELRARLRHFLETTSASSSVRQYVQRAELLLAAALVNLEATENG